MYRPVLIITLTILLALILDLTGALHVYGLSAWSGQKLSSGAALLLLGIAFGWVVTAFSGTCGRFDRQSVARVSRILKRPVALLMLLAWLATLYDYRAFFAPDGMPMIAVSLAIGTLFFVVVLVRPLSPGYLVAGAVLLGTVVRLVSMASVPIDPAHDDMLPLVQGALGQLLAGESPYAVYEMPWDLPLTYLPVTWLAYLPAYLLGVDMRVTNLLAELAIGATIAWLVSEQVGRKKPESLWYNAAGLLLWAWFFLQPTALNWTLSTTAPVQWALLGLLLALVMRRRFWLSAVLLGLTAAATPLVSVVAPFVLLHWLRSLGWRHTLTLVMCAGLLATVIILPFFFWAPDQFVLGVWRWFNDNDLYPRLRWDMGHTWAHHVGFSGMFWRHDLVNLLKPLQAVMLISLALIYWLRQATLSALLPLCVAAFLLFMLFNPVLWPYLYNPALIAALIAVSTCSHTYHHPVSSEA